MQDIASDKNLNYHINVGPQVIRDGNTSAVSDTDFAEAD